MKLFKEVTDFVGLIEEKKEKEGGSEKGGVKIALIAVISGLTCERGERVNFALY